jgi:hypothetical protein
MDLLHYRALTPNVFTQPSANTSVQPRPSQVIDLTPVSPARQLWEDCERSEVQELILYAATGCDDLSEWAILISANQTVYIDMLLFIYLTIQPILVCLTLELFQAFLSSVCLK